MMLVQCVVGLQKQSHETDAATTAHSPSSHVNDLHETYYTITLRHGWLMWPKLKPQGPWQEKNKAK